jgi:hypothetical protein
VPNTVALLELLFALPRRLVTLGFAPSSSAFGARLKLMTTWASAGILLVLFKNRERLFKYGGRSDRLDRSLTTIF